MREELSDNVEVYRLLEAQRLVLWMQDSNDGQGDAYELGTEGL